MTQNQGEAIIGGLLFIASCLAVILIFVFEAGIATLNHQHEESRLYDKIEKVLMDDNALAPALKSCEKGQQK